MYRNKRPSNIRTNISNSETEAVLDENIKTASGKGSNLNTYIKYLLLLYSSTNKKTDIFDKMFYIRELEKTVRENSHMLKGREKLHITNFIQNNRYISTRNYFAGMKIQIFPYIFSGMGHLHFSGNITDPAKSIIKTYIYPTTVSKKIENVIKESYYNEITFQIYAKTMNEKVGFITPEIYSYGFFYIHESGIRSMCLYIIMEFIEGVVWRNVMFNIDTYKNMYERLDQIDGELKTNMLSHNDLHPGNVIITPDNQIAIIDYGESGMRTNDCIGSRLPKMPKPDISLL